MKGGQVLVGCTSVWGRVLRKGPKGCFIRAMERHMVWQYFL